MENATVMVPSFDVLEDRLQEEVSDTHTHSHTHTHTHKHACTHTHTHTSMHAHTHTHTHTSMHAHTHTHTQACMHTHTHTHTSMHAHTHTHTHTHTQFFFTPCPSWTSGRIHLLYFVTNWDKAADLGWCIAALHSLLSIITSCQFVILVIYADQIYPSQRCPS